MSRTAPLGATILVHVQPRAKTTAVAGWHGDAVKVRVAAPPVGGAANEALLRFLAERLDVPPAAITLVAGAAARRKRVRVAGLSADEVLRRLGIER